MTLNGSAKRCFDAFSTPPADDQFMLRLTAKDERAYAKLNERNPKESESKQYWK
jgi:hypothetical protein